MLPDGKGVVSMYVSTVSFRRTFFYTHRDDEGSLPRRAARGDVPVLPAVVLRGVLRVAGCEHDRPAAGRGCDRAAARAEGESGEVLLERGASTSENGRTRGRGGGDDAGGARGCGGGVHVCRRGERAAVSRREAHRSCPGGERPNPGKRLRRCVRPRNAARRLGTFARGGGGGGGRRRARDGGVPVFTARREGPPGPERPELAAEIRAREAEATEERRVGVRRDARDVDGKRRRRRRRVKYFTLFFYLARYLVRVPESHVNVVYRLSQHKTNVSRPKRLPKRPGKPSPRFTRVGARVRRRVGRRVDGPIVRRVRNFDSSLFFFSRVIVNGVRERR
jgi:hypothetical protein